MTIAGMKPATTMMATSKVNVRACCRAEVVEPFHRIRRSLVGLSHPDVGVPRGRGSANRSAGPSRHLCMTHLP